MTSVRSFLPSTSRAGQIKGLRLFSMPRRLPNTDSGLPQCAFSGRLVLLWLQQQLGVPPLELWIGAMVWRKLGLINLFAEPVP